ncbi:MAG: LAGLIDADG family homing endonuclease [Methanocellales archaeon]|nr:LAGLIDADG family homing endonuclease [Methanocellales archaeon]
MVGDTVSRWEEFLEQYYKEHILQLASTYPEERSLFIEFPDIVKKDPELADALLERPHEILPDLEESLRTFATPTGEPLDDAHVRIVKIPDRVQIRKLRSDNISRLIAIEGLVRKATAVRPKIVNAAFDCLRCGHTTHKEQTGTKFTEPYACENESCDRKGPFKLNLNESIFVDAQKLQIQESPEDLRGGEQPQTLDVNVEDDLAGIVTPGDRIIVTGILHSYQRTSPVGKSTFFDVYLECISIEIQEQEFEELDISKEEEKEILKLSEMPNIYETVINSIAPTIFGYNDIKEAIALQLFAGVAKLLPDGTRVRGDVHVLLVGDPGTAKSQLLRYIATLAPRGIYTSGKGTTAAGLTATAVRDEFGEGRWTLEAGALVLADKGVAAVDELDKMRDEDRSALHEAMEQQSYHPSTEILLSDGRKVKIGEYVDGLFNKNEDKIIKGVDCEILPLCANALKRSMLPREFLFSTDFNAIFKLPIDRVSRHVPPDRFVQIKYSNGREIIVTPEHPIYVFRHGAVGCVPAIDVEENDFIPAPRVVPNYDSVIELHQIDRTHVHEKDIVFPGTLSPDLAAILGFLISEGHSYRGSSAEIGFSNTNNGLLDSMSRLMMNVFGVNYSWNSNAYGTITLRYVSTRLHRWFADNFPEMMRTAKDKRVPAKILGTSKDNIREFLRTAFLGDGGVESTAICYRTASKGLAEDYQDLLLKLGIASRIVQDVHNHSYKTYIAGDSLGAFYDQIVDFEDVRCCKIRSMVSKSKETLRHHDVVPTDVARVVIKSLKSLGMVNDGYFCRHLNKDHGITVDTMKKYVHRLRDRYEEIQEALKLDISLRELRDRVNWSQRQLADEMGVFRSTIDYLERGGYNEERRGEILQKAKQVISNSISSTLKNILELDRLLNSDIRFLRVTSVKVVPNKGKYRTNWVYDVTVEPTHNFISHGVVLHNTVSIAKAGVMAMLRSRCALLGAANPKYGRFDRYESIAEQINLPPTLLSRFDLIFPLADEPDETLDTNIAEHILRAHYAGELAEHAKKFPSGKITKEDVKSAMEMIQPEIGPELFRKYIAYAKRIYPIMVDDAKQRLTEFYLGLRKQGIGIDSPVPVTARSLEALVRLAEASARIRLSDAITEEDANRAIRIVESCLRKVAVDPETGQFDVDIIAVGTSKSQRDKIKILREIIRELEKEHGGRAPKEDIYDKAQAQGISKDIVEELIAKLKQQGDIFEPATGYLKLA